MNLKRFTGRTSRDALALVRQAFGNDAVVMSTRPCAEGVEVLAMAPESLQHLEKLSASAPAAAAQPREQRSTRAAALQQAVATPTDGPVDQDVERLAMSTLSFQDYVRERMLKRRRSEMAGRATPTAAVRLPPVAAMIPPPAAPSVALRTAAGARPAPRQAPVPAAADSLFMRDLADDEAAALEPAPRHPHVHRWPRAARASRRREREQADTDQRGRRCCASCARCAA
jgi:flagellar biosynthesis protein FlhF